MHAKFGKHSTMRIGCSWLLNAHFIEIWSQNTKNMSILKAIQQNKLIPAINIVHRYIQTYPR